MQQKNYFFNFFLGGDILLTMKYRTIDFFQYSSTFLHKKFLKITGEGALWIKNTSLIKKETLKPRNTFRLKNEKSLQFHYVLKRLFILFGI